MDHDEAVRQKATEKYMLDELDPALRDQFEEHLFDCQECALDLRAAAMLVEQSKVILAEELVPVVERVRVPLPAKSGWFAWLRPTFAVPVFALLLAVIVYQNQVYSRLQQKANSPQFLASVVVNLGTRGGEGIAVPARAGQPFELSLNVPPDSRYASYKLDLYSAPGRLEWTRTIPASGSGTVSLYIPGRHVPGSDHASPSALAVQGITTGGESVDLGRYEIDLQDSK
ncbi:MAG: zf-HC2 domain-containing protein [Candidatus Sulfotelmatobacter sp.]